MGGRQLPPCRPPSPRRLRDDVPDPPLRSLDDAIDYGRELIPAVRAAVASRDAAAVPVAA
jgi:hypothetical protein